MFRGNKWECIINVPSIDSRFKFRRTILKPNFFIFMITKKNIGKRRFKTCDSKFVMASFDIKSLFTNIPLQETTNLCVENSFQDRTHIDNLLKDSFCELFTRTMSESLILFDQEFYKQHDGVTMISPLGLRLPMFFFVIMKKVVLLNLNLLSIEGTLMIHSHFLPRNITSKNSEII